MRSDFIKQDIIKKESLKRFRDDEWGCIITESGGIDFEEWNEWKLYGYWYEECVEVLKAIAPYLEGYAEFEYEGGFKFRIIFADSRCYSLKAEEIWNDENKELL